MAVPLVASLWPPRRFLSKSCLAPALPLHQPVVLNAVAAKVFQAVIAPGIAWDDMRGDLPFPVAAPIRFGIFASPASAFPKFPLSRNPIFAKKHFGTICPHVAFRINVLLCDSLAP